MSDKEMGTEQEQVNPEELQLDPMSREGFEQKMRDFIRGEQTLGDLYQISHEEMYEMLREGQNLLDAGRYADAQKVFEGLIALDPTEANFHFALAATFQHQDQLDEALLEYDRTLSLNNTELAARTNRAEVLMMKGELEKAVQDLTWVIKQDPKGEHPHTRRAQTLAVALKAMAEEQAQKEGLDPGKVGKSKKTAAGKKTKKKTKAGKKDR